MNPPDAPTQKARVCFVSLNSAHLLFSGNSNFMGGAELQQILIGSELSRRGRGVSFVTRKPEPAGQPANSSINIVTTFAQSEGWPVVRFFYPRGYTIMKALLSVEADIYYVRGSSFILALVVYAARLRKRKVVFCGAYDLDFIPDKVTLPSLRDKWMYLWALKRVDAVIAQNEVQHKLVHDHFGLRADKIHNCYPAVAERSAFCPEALWAGNFRDTKNPESYLKLAENIPEFQFNMIGGKPGQRDYAKIEEAARRIGNLRFLGFQPLQETEKLFGRVKLFVNTSEYEGFPNTFLQAWAHGVPVISFVDPDNLVSRHRLGLVVKNLHEMIDGARAILNGEVAFDGDRIRTYFSENHLVGKIVDQYEALFDTVVGKG